MLVWYYAVCLLCVGLFFQWISCIAIWTTGFVLHAIRQFPKFYPLSMLGGFLWCSGENISLYINVGSCFSPSVLSAIKLNRSLSSGSCVAVYYRIHTVCNACLFELLWCQEISADDDGVFSCYLNFMIRMSSRDKAVCPAPRAACLLTAEDWTMTDCQMSFIAMNDVDIESYSPGQIVQVLLKQYTSHTVLV